MLVLHILVMYSFSGPVWCRPNIDIYTTSCFLYWHIKDAIDADNVYMQSVFCLIVFIYDRPTYALPYSTVSQKRSHLMFDNNFGKCGPIFKIISPIDS